MHNGIVFLRIVRHQGERWPLWGLSPLSWLRLTNKRSKHSPVSEVSAKIARRARRSICRRQVVEEVPRACTVPFRGEVVLQGQHLDDDADPVYPAYKRFLVVGHLSQIAGGQTSRAEGGGRKRRELRAVRGALTGVQ